MPKLPVQTKSKYIDEHQSDTRVAIRTSDRGEFKKCRRRWNYASPIRGNWDTQGLNENFWFGTAFHAGLEAFYDPMRASLPVEARQVAAIAAFNESCKTIDKVENGKEFLSKRTYLEYLELGTAMLEYYFKYDPFESFEVVGVEVDFSIPIGLLLTNGKFIPYPADIYGAGIDARNTWVSDIADVSNIDKFVYYEGKIDLIIKDSRGRVYVVDHKTTSQFGHQFYLDIDTQVSSYVWALWVLGYNVIGAVYNEFLKSTPQAPKVLKNGGLSVAKNQNVTAATWLEGLGMTVEDWQASGTGDQKYDEFVSYLLENPKQYIRPTRIERNIEQVQIQGQMILEEAADMLESPRIYPAPNQMVCNFCAFRGPCLAANEGRDDQMMLEFGPYKARKPRHWR